jgi:hypothetical protein
MSKFIFQLFKKTNKVADEPHYEIMCDTNGIIVDVTNDVVQLLGFEKQVLLSSFIGRIMSPFLSYIHSNVLLPKYHSANNIQKNIIHLFLSGKTVKRPLIIYTITRAPIYVKLYIRLTNKHFHIQFSIKNDLRNSSVYLQNNINDGFIVNDRFKKTKNSVVQISLDFKTESTKPNTTLGEIELHNKFHDDIIKILKSYYYPYLYIYEITNEHYMFVLNVEWLFHTTGWCASLAISFLRHVYLETQEYCSFRAGVTYNALYWGFIDNKMRLFGNEYALSHKLRCQLLQYEIAVDCNFWDKLDSENIYSQNNVYEERRLLHNLDNKEIGVTILDVSNSGLMKGII